jgi:hypothetical protein
MAAEDHLESYGVTTDGTLATGSPRGVVVLAPFVHDWLAARTAGAVAELSVSVVAYGARCVLRVEVGESASAIEWQSRAEVRVGELAAAVRRWAREQALSARTEQGRGAEARVIVTPHAATQS